MNKGISYNDICLQARHFDGETRKTLNIQPLYGEYFSWSSPIIPANMATTISFEKAEELAKNNLPYILHRFYNYDEIYAWVEINVNKMLTSISLGIHTKDYELINRFKDNNIIPHCITIDVAHGDSQQVEDIIYFIRSKFKHTVKIIAGNVMTPEACIRLIHSGADAVKVGLSMGKACTTYNVTGVGSPMYSTIKECRTWIDKVFVRNNIKPFIIADGGIREIGDFAKAIHAGADYVMVGSMFNRCIDSPTEHLNKKSLYYGSASARNKGHDSYVEGDNGQWLDENGLTYLGLYQKIKEGLQSSISYAGGNSLYDIRAMEAILIK